MNLNDVTDYAISTTMHTYCQTLPTLALYGLSGRTFT